MKKPIKQTRVREHPQLTWNERYKILERDNFSCFYCGASGKDTRITVDHVIPMSRGGTNEESNLVAACADCNAGKGRKIIGVKSGKRCFGVCHFIEHAKSQCSCSCCSVKRL